MAGKRKNKFSFNVKNSFNKIIKRIKAISRKNKYRYSSVILAVISVFIFIFTFVGQIIAEKPGNEVTPNPTQRPEAVDRESSIAVNMGGEPLTLNPIIATDDASKNIIRHTLECLVRLDKNGDPVPAAAEKWTISEDNLTWTFNIRKQSLWQDKTPVKASDFEFAFKLHLDAALNSPYKDQMRIFKGVDEFLSGTGTIENVGIKSTAENTLILTLKAPITNFLKILSETQFSPVQQAFYEANKKVYGTEPMYLSFNGPWYVYLWEHSRKIVMPKNNIYWNSANINANQLTFISSGTTESKLNQLKVGNYDYISLSAGEIDLYKENDFTINNYNDGGTVFLEFNMADPLMSNFHLRKALAYSVDRTKLIQAAGNNSEAAFSLANPESIYMTEAQAIYNDTKISLTEAFSELLPLAKAELAAAALTEEQLNGGVSILVDDSAISRKMAELLAQQWKEGLGITVNVKAYNYTKRVDAIRANDYQILVNSYQPLYSDLNNILSIFNSGSPKGNTNYVNADFNTALVNITAAKDIASSKAAYISAFNILNSSLPAVPLYYRHSAYVQTSRVINIISDASRDIDLYYSKVNYDISTAPPQTDASPNPAATATPNAAEPTAAPTVAPLP